MSHVEKYTSKKIFEANHIFKTGIRVWPEMLNELFIFRGLIWRLTVRDITARYKQSVFGILWAVLSPLIMTGVFLWVKNNNVLPIGETAMPYVVYVFAGQMVWMLFSQGLLTSTNSLVAADSMLSKINFPREVLVFSAIGQTVFDFLIRIPLLAVIFFWTGFTPNISILLVPLILLPLLFLTLGVGFFLALLNAVIRDTGSALGIIINLGMFVTPVIYPPPESWPLSFLINHINPVSAFVTAVHGLISSGFVSNNMAFLSSTIISFLFFLSGWRLFHLIEPKIAERI